MIGLQLILSVSWTFSVRTNDMKKVTVNGVETTNREIDRERDREAKRYIRLKIRNETNLQKKEISVSKKSDFVKPVLVLSVNVLTEYSNRQHACGEYRTIKRRKVIVEDEFEHIRLPGAESEKLKQKTGSEHFVNLRSGKTVTRKKCLSFVTFLRKHF